MRFVLWLVLFVAGMATILVGPWIFPTPSEEFKGTGTAVIERPNAERKLGSTIKLCFSEPVEAPLNLLSSSVVDPIVSLHFARLSHVITVFQSNLCLGTLDSQIWEQCSYALCRLVGTAIPSELRLAILREELRIVNYAYRAAKDLRENVNSEPVGLLNEDSQSIAESLSLPTTVTNDSDTTIGVDNPSEVSENVSVHDDSITPQEGTVNVALTFYTCEPFCIGDLMANGQPLSAGDVACGYALETGQRFTFNGAEYVCEDRGRGPYYWVDFWKPTYEIGQAWQAEVGMTGTIELLPR